MSDINYQLNSLWLAVGEAEELFNRPWPDWDVLGPDAESPQLAAAAKLMEAYRDFVGWALPDAPTGLMTEIHGGFADLAAGRSARLFERPRKAGAPSMPIREECAMVSLSAITTLLIEGGWKKSEALAKVSRAGGVSPSTLARFRTNLHMRPNHIQGLYRKLMQDMFSHEAKEYERYCAASSAPVDLRGEIIRKIKERAGLNACGMLSTKKQFCPSTRSPRRERAG